MDKTTLFLVGYLCFLGGLGVGVALMDSVNNQRREEDQATALRKVAEDDQLAMMRKIADDAAANPEAPAPDWAPTPGLTQLVRDQAGRVHARGSGVPGRTL